MSKNLTVFASSWFRLISVDDQVLRSKDNERNSYLPSEETFGMNEYFRPDGNPAPPRPLKPESLIS
jgi:hypothetical protein